MIGEWLDFPELLPPTIDADNVQTMDTESGNVLLIPVNSNRFPTIPMLIEASEQLALFDYGINRIPHDALDQVEEVWMMHPLCFPMVPTYVVEYPSDEYWAPAVPPDWRERHLSINPRDPRHILWSLWAFEGFIDCKGHRVKQIDDGYVIYTPYNIYRVPRPIHPLSPPQFMPGVFWHIPVEEIEMAGIVKMTTSAN